MADWIRKLVLKSPKLDQSQIFFVNNSQENIPIHWPLITLTNQLRITKMGQVSFRIYNFQFNNNLFLITLTQLLPCASKEQKYVASIFNHSIDVSIAIVLSLRLETILPWNPCLPASLNASYTSFNKLFALQLSGRKNI